MKKLSLALALSAVLLTGCSDSSETEAPAIENAPRATEQKATEPQQAEPVKKQEERMIPMGLTVKSFEKRYNVFVVEFNKMGTGIKMNKLSITKFEAVEGNKDVQVFQACSSKHTCVLGQSETSTGNLLSINASATGDGTEASGMMALTHLILSASSAIPSAKKYNELSSEILTLIKGDGEFTNTLESRGYVLDFTRNNRIGNWLTIKKE